MAQRNLVFSKGKYGLFGDSLPLLGWAAFSLILLLVARPGRRVSRYGSGLRALSLGMALLCLGFVLVASTGWGRYRLIRLETLTLSLGITGSPGEGKRTNLTGEILSQTSGPYLLQDVPFMRYLAGRGQGYLDQPRAARVLYASLLAHGVTEEELWDNSTTRVFLLACLMAEAEPMSEPMARRIVSYFSDQASRNDRSVAEGLVFCLVQFPALFTSQSRERVMESWASKFQDLEPLAVEGLIRRKQVQALLSGLEMVSIRLEMQGAEGNRDLQAVLPEAVEGLIRSCGVSVGGTEAPELQVRLRLREIPHHQFSRPTYKYETYYQESQRHGSKYWHQPQRLKKERQVLTGYQTETQLAPVIQVTLTRGKESLQLPETLVYWHHLRFDQQRKVFLDVKNEGVYGRMWPFGVRQALYQVSLLRK